MMLRRCRRAVALAWALAHCALRYWAIRLRGPLSLERRALWLQSASCGVLRSLSIRVEVEGTLPGGGLVVSNHLSYLDIVIYSAAMPCVFVSKAEVNRWPFFGFAARAGGTVFLDRASLASANNAANSVAARLALPIPVLLFPEGTSTDGSQVQRFHRRLIQPAIEARTSIAPAAIRYLPEDGAAERELCWYGDAGFLSHLWKVLGVAGFSARIRFGQPRVYTDTRIAAEQTHDEVAAMRGHAPSFASAAELAMQRYNIA
jgi:1-acyl-sn-glycerol-3-phosphate acyltransferase